MRKSIGWQVSGDGKFGEPDPEEECALAEVDLVGESISKIPVHQFQSPDNRQRLRRPLSQRRFREDQSDLE